MASLPAADPMIDVICDLRQFDQDVDDVGSMLLLWQQIGEQIEGKTIRTGEAIAATLSEGQVNLWLVDTHGISQIGPDTSFRIIDLLRSPKLLYRCAVCGQYGPFRCIACEDADHERRLCADHAHTIKDELRAYCREHIPLCQCRVDCREQATFRCRRCRNLFGNHYHRQHPHDQLVDYCHWCYRALFETCEAPGCRLLGRSKCAFQTRSMADPCQKPLCSKHSYQWKIWGPHNRGVTLCEQHKRTLGATDPADLLFMMLTAQAPYARRGRRQSLPNPFRLRRIINRNRVVDLTFDQLGHSLRSLESQVSGWNNRAEGNYRYLSRNYFEATGGIGIAESELLIRVRAFYQAALGWSAAQQIIGLEITDRYYKPGQPPRYRAQLYLSTSNKGPFIGPKGATINRLRQQLNLEIDL